MRNGPIEIWPGSPRPLGARWDGAGTNFALFSEVAERVELCLFDDDGREMRVDLPEERACVWHGYAPNVGPGQRYGFRVHGPFEPHRGQRCNPNKLLVDPYARAITGKVDWHPSVFGHVGNDDTVISTSDSAPYVPKSVVANPYFDWGRDRPPQVPSHRSVIYEAHVVGLTARHSAVPEALRGTYAGVSHPAVLDHLLQLGVTAVELLPVHHFVHESFLVERGLTNYWGYSTLGYFAPHASYARTGTEGHQVFEFKAMVKALHEAGLEVILDVVYNHTGEGSHLGPTLSFRGIDNAAYYRVSPSDPRQIVDYTGCGNSLNVRHPHVLQLIMDSLRYWVVEMHVDGFRFDLAATLARELHDVDRLATFFTLLQQDPVLGHVKLIAEPWDLGEGGYQVGNFPARWSEWNGKFRDTVRDYWRGRDQTLGEFAYRFTGSSDLYGMSGRNPFASINFVTAHDGFTLRDLVSYNEKHNEANLEGNRDGENHNRSWNCGHEGKTDDADILALRRRQQRNFLATLFLSQGIPMLTAGDEIGNTQCGNNNAYCQDNEIGHVNWESADEALLRFTSKLARLKREHPVFRRRRWFQRQSVRGTDHQDIAWFRPDGREMTDDDWSVGYARSLGVYLSGDGIPTVDRYGRPVVDDSFYVIFNAHHGDLAFTLPATLTGVWQRVFDTSLEPSFDDSVVLESSAVFNVGARSTALFVRRRHMETIPPPSRGLTP